jgi:hypothetical protein
MPMRFAVLTMAAALALRAGEVIDCVAVAVGRDVITRSEIAEQARITALLNREKADLSPAMLRRTAERLVDVTLIRREMRVANYAAPGQRDVDTWLERIRQERGATPEILAREMVEQGIDDAALRRNLLLQLQTLRFIELRFRPGSSVSEGEVELYYRDTFLPEFEKANPGKAAPDLDDARERIESELLQRRVDQALEVWLKDARSRVRILYFERSCL